MANGYGMMLDRDLRLHVLDVAYDVGRHDRDPKSSRPTLEVRLRDHVSPQEANNKTKKCLTRVWLNPPPEAAEMIAWALDRPTWLSHPVLLHYGAMLATYPFVGVVARIVGRYLRSEGTVHAKTVRDEVKKVVGGTATVDMSARKSYTTLTHLGLIQKNGQQLSPSKSIPAVPAHMGPWLLHALLLTRQAAAIDASSVRSAPELLGIELKPRVADYPLLDEHQQTESVTFTPAHD